MTKRVLRAAAGAAVLGIVLSLATPVASQAAPMRRESEAVADASAQSGLWLSLTGFWNELVSLVVGGSESGGEGAEAPDGEEENSESDRGPGVDPNG